MAQYILIQRLKCLSTHKKLNTINCFDWQVMQTAVGVFTAVVDLRIGRQKTIPGLNMRVGLRRVHMSAAQKDWSL